jgi:uncharacterized protein YqhQ
MPTPLNLPSYGGQAVIEGVMMRGAQTCAIAMRAPSGEIVLHSEPLGSLYQSQIKKIPLVRGLVMLWDALGLGMRALTISANTQTGEEEKLEGPALYGTVAFSLLLGIGLFVLLPAGASQLTTNVLGWNPWLGNLAEGVIRLLLFIGYLALIGRMPDIQRVFAYHGAEHKTINAFEAGSELIPEKVAAFPLQHTRCGTSFLLTVVLLSIFFFSLIGPLPGIWHYVVRILMMPVLAMFAYEYIRWTAGHLHWRWVRWLIQPNLALQQMTTREPSLDMLEVSIAAFNTMRAQEKDMPL